MASLQSYEELQANLEEYQAQLEQVGQLLLMDHENEELQDMYNGLHEAIELTGELLKEARNQPDAGISQPAEVSAPSTSAPSGTTAAPATSALPQARIATPPQLNLPSILPSSVAEQIRRAQMKAALAGQAPAAWAIGARVEALYSGDGAYYPATVKAAVAAGGGFVVEFEGYGNEEEVAVGSVRLPTESAETYQGVAAPKRKRVDDQPSVTEIPKWLEIKETDDEKTKAKKRKLMKSYKSKLRFQNMDIAQREKQQSWQSFMKGKGTKKKPGFLTGTKKESMFKSPEDLKGKVGVVGSGRGMTDFQKRSRHEFSLDD